ncbi:MAG: type II secretion system GspH family protein [Candidatus Omnitrophica bacterium]|nr:type II secretion system GspH family protein [Candidatus Omnitrophota bacterium]
MKRLKINKNGFTFIELLMALALISIVFIPVMNMLSVALEQARVLSDLSTARTIAQEEMEKIKNLNFTVEQLIKQGDQWTPPLNQPGIKLNNSQWRALRHIQENKGPLKVWVKVYKEGDLNQDLRLANPLIEFVTLCQDLNW